MTRAGGRGKPPGLFAIEHSRAAYRADFALYAMAVLLLGGFLLSAGPRRHWLGCLMLAATGLLAWSAVEYALHRFVLHGVQPFQRWHEQHHLRPAALISTPTVLSAALIALLVFLPVLLLGSLWQASALTLGLLAGYLAYAVTHHATHHWRAEGPWLARRKRRHALHHHGERGRCYGVTSAFWDRVFGTAV